MVGVCSWFLTTLLFLFLSNVGGNDDGTAFVVVLDAGSTGSRCYVYSYDSLQPLHTIMEVAHMRVNPALSTFVGNAAGLSAQLSSLISFAKGHVQPATQWETTNITLKATAGLRSLPGDDQQYLIDVVKTVLATSGFSFDPTNTGVITGEQEALYDVLAVNAALDKTNRGATGGIWPLQLMAGDMGGSSQQIAFSMGNSSISSFSSNSIANTAEVDQQGQGIVLGGIPAGTVAAGDTAIAAASMSSTSTATDTDTRSGPLSSKQCKADWRVESDGHSVEIFAKSLEFMGLIAAMDTVLLTFYGNATVAAHLKRKPLTHPCLPSGKFPQHIELPEPWQKAVWGEVPQPLFGSGDFDECHQLVKSILVPLARQAVDLDCVRQGRVGSNRVIVGMDNFPKVLEGMTDRLAD